MRVFVVRLVLIKLRHCGHLALSSCLTLRAKYYMLCLAVLKACVQKLCVLLCIYSIVLRCSLFGECVIVPLKQYDNDDDGAFPMTLSDL